MADMDAVNSFNAELQSLYDVKPPISKGKMTSITRAALKAVKLYKHVVQSVEKFIQKCKAEYKIPGLYVIDSIIRQSRHQFGPEKDVFAPRFSRNIQNTFVHLYRCPEEDKSKVIRVLNLWQKNSIFSPEVIQPLFDLADPQNPIWDQIGSQNSNSESTLKNSGGGSTSNHNSAGNSSQLGFSSLPPVHFNKKVLDFDYGDGDEDGGQNSSNATGKNSEGNPPGPLDALGSILSNPEILRQLQTLQEQMAAATGVQGHLSNYVATPEQERQRKLAELSKQEAAFDQRLAETVARLPFAKDCELPLAQEGDSRGDTSVVDQNSNQLSSGQSGNNPSVLLPPAFFQQLAEQQGQTQHQQQSSQQQLFQTLLRNASNAASNVNQQNPFNLPMNFPIQGVPPPFPPQDASGSSSVPHHGLFGQSETSAYFNHLSSSNQQQQHHHHQPQITISQKIYEEIDLCAEDSKDEHEMSSSHRTGDRDRSGRSKRSRSHDRHDSGRRGRRSRSRSRSRGRSKRSYRSRSRDRAREDREKEKERQRKGLPPIKKEHLSICSTTLWVGHLSKLVSQEEISDTFGTYGDIVSIDLIPPRGCAFIVMNRRQDAVRALDRLKNTKLQGKTITLAWAPGKGVKGKEWKDYWEVGDGVSYIPWNKLRDDVNLEEFEDGGCIDEDTLPEFLKNRPQTALDGNTPHDQKTLVPPLPLDNENSQDSNSLIAPPLPPPTSIGVGMPGAPPPPATGLPSLLDHAALAAAMGKAADTDSRQDAPPPMPFGMGPPGMGMMPMGMNLMVPPPMLAMAPGPFQGMASLPGMPMMGMGMVPPTMPVPPVSTAAPTGPTLAGHGLLGEIPGGAPQPPLGMPPAHLNDSLLSTNNDESAMSGSDLISNSEEGQGTKRAKKRSRFDDPVESKMSPARDNSIETNNFSPSQDLMKDDRPVFERLKSLAEGYSFGNQDKTSAGGPGSLMGNPPGLGPRPLLPNSFRPVRPPSLFTTAPTHPSSGGGAGGWGFGDNTENPFLNPNPSNPFATAGTTGNPFAVAGNFSSSENPFDISASTSGANPFAPPVAGSEMGGFGGNEMGVFGGGRRGGWGREGTEWGGRGRGGRGGRGWRGGRGAGGWGSENQPEELMEIDLESRGFRGRGTRGRDVWGGRGDKPGDRRDRGDRDRPRSREGDRGSSRGRRSRSPSQRRGDDNERGNRRRRNSSNERDSRRSRYRSPADDSRRRSDKRQDNLQSAHTTATEQAPDEDWEHDAGKPNESWEQDVEKPNEENHNQDQLSQQSVNEESWGEASENLGMNTNESNEQRNHPRDAEEDNSRLNENSWTSENQEENEYPREEQVAGEEAYLSQEHEEDDRRQFESETVGSHHRHHHQENEHSNEGEEHDLATNNEAVEDDVGNYGNHDYSGGGSGGEVEECDRGGEVYDDRRRENHNESYDDDDSYRNHQEADSNSNEYSNYNNDQEYDSRNNGSYCGGGGFSGEYNDNGDDDDDGERQEPQSTSYDNEDTSEPVPTPEEAHATKCTFNNVNSSNNSAPEEMNSISS